MNYQHKELAQGRWFELGFFEQMANVGAEVGRAIKWKNKANNEYGHMAFERALELLWLTIEDKKNRGAKLKELCRLKEVLADYFVGQNEYRSSAEGWQRYFDAFNIAANLERMN